MRKVSLIQGSRKNKKKWSSLKWATTVLLLLLIVIAHPTSLHSMELVVVNKDVSRFSLVARTVNQLQAFEYTKELTKDEYAGRNSGTEGCEKAADWIASQFKAWNLKPYKEDSYFQPFSPPLSFHSTSNVIGYIPARNKKSKQSIILGAHYDHLGKDRSGNIYRGANDNASGTGTMMEIVRTLSECILITDINIVFIAFSAEEKGLHGSYFYARNPLFPLSEVVAMINLDMVGTGNGPWELGTNFERVKLLDNALKTTLSYYRISYRLASWYLKPVSDHYPFYEKGVPVLFIFRANPSNKGGYHTLKDTIDTVDPKNLGECGKMAVVILLFACGNHVIVIPKIVMSHVPSFMIPVMRTGLIFSDSSL